ncbi:MAG: hypothetical protein NDJ89_06955 [Oligoflexia bacterium]|nr:hypothetical protein [Oligoflexia bacterium]
MSEKKPPKTASNTPATPAPAAASATPTSFPTPEAEVNHRIKELQAQVVTLQKEIRMTQGRFANRSPEIQKALEKENQDLRLRLSALEKALLAIHLDAHLPRRLEEEKTQYEALRLAIVEYCKKTNIDPEIWKNLVS